MLTKKKLHIHLFLLHGFLKDFTDRADGCNNANGFSYQSLDCFILAQWTQTFALFKRLFAENI